MLRDVLTATQATVLELLSGIPEVRTFYLAGGTALALHLGHRRSTLRPAGDLRVLQEAAGTLTVQLRGVSTSFFRYDYPRLRPLHAVPWGLAVADPADSAAMKLSAIAGRGSRKDFVDLYVYVRRVEPLEQVFAHFRAKFLGLEVDPHHLLRSLAYFEDADAEPMPEMLDAVSWEDVRGFFRAEAARLFRDLAP